MTTKTETKTDKVIQKEITSGLMIMMISSDLPRQGKSELAEMMAKKINSISGKRAVVLSLASVLKDEVADKCSLDRKRLENDSVYKNIHRPKLITYGAMMRAINPDYWCEKLYDAIKTEYLLTNIGNGVHGLTVIVPDLRFHNEKQFFNDRFPCYHIHVTVNAYQMILRVGADFNLYKNDESEKDFQLATGVSADYYVDNSHDKDFLKVQAYSILKNCWII